MKNAIVLAALLLFYLSSKTQSALPSVDLTNIVPRPPEAAQLLRVGEITTNSARGVPQISYNLYTATAGNLKIPITLSYDASGIRWDDVAGVVGMKWSLQAGGEVSRSVNGREDEYFYLEHGSQYTYNTLAYWNYGTDSAQSFFRAVEQGTKDIYQDNWSYNFLDKSGYLYFGKNKFWDSKNPFTQKIEVNSLYNLSNWTITDELGNKAFFGNEQEFTDPNYGDDGYVKPYQPINTVTAWKLDKLKAYTGQEATFEYHETFHTRNQLLSEAYVNSPSAGEEGFTCNCNLRGLKQNKMITGYTQHPIKKIITPNEEVYFEFIPEGFIGKITVKDKNANLIKTIRLTYTSEAQLEKIWNVSGSDSTLIAGFHYKDRAMVYFSRDLFGYHNGAYNTNLISTNIPQYLANYTSADRNINNTHIVQGVLDIIYHPTGGQTEFFYAANAIDTTYGPGIRVDSIKYVNNGVVVSQTDFTYSEPQNAHAYNGYPGNFTFDNSNEACSTWTIHSELPPITPTSTFYYKVVETRRKDPATNSVHLTKEFFRDEMNCYTVRTPVNQKTIQFRGNSLTDTLRIDSVVYTDLAIDTLMVDWVTVATAGVAPSSYYLDGSWQLNNDCRKYYTGPELLVSLKPRISLPTAIVSKEFDQNTSSAYLVNTQHKIYNGYWQNVADWKFNSDGTLDSTVYKHLYTNNDGLTSSVKSSNLYGLVDEVRNYTSSATHLQTSRVRFATQSNGYIQPDSFFVKTLSNNELAHQVVTAYDTSGNITEVDNKKGFYTSLLRDYNNELLVAQVAGARLSQVAYTSFEAESKGGWTFSGSINPSSGITGTRSYSLLGGDITKSGLASATYIVSYWSTGGPCTVNGSSSPAKTGHVLDNWTYYEHEVTGTSITISGSVTIDEVRLYPKGAQMTTYTYLPLVGIQSQCDASSRISYYEYDAYNRLKNIRDQDKNILKAFEYKYASQ